MLIIFRKYSLCARPITRLKLVEYLAKAKKRPLEKIFMLPIIRCDLPPIDATSVQLISLLFSTDAANWHFPLASPLDWAALAKETWNCEEFADSLQWVFCAIERIKVFWLCRLALMSSGGMMMRAERDLIMWKIQFIIEMHAHAYVHLRCGFESVQKIECKTIEIAF